MLRNQKKKKLEEKNRKKIILMAFDSMRLSAYGVHMKMKIVKFSKWNVNEFIGDILSVTNKLRH